MAPSITSHYAGQSYVVVITWFLFCMTFVAVLARIATKWVVKRSFDREDLVISIALIFGTATSIAVTTATSHGLGKHIDMLNSSQVDVFEKSMFVASLLNVATLFLSKIAVVLLLRLLTPVGLHQQLALFVGFTTVMWTATSLIAIGFQCKPPKVWNSIDNQCFDRTAFWNYFAATNILTDIMLVLLPTLVLWNVKIDSRRKLAIVSCFASRLLVVAAVIVQIVYLNKMSDTHDPTFDALPTVICTQIVDALSIVTACIPYLKPLYLSIESGMLRSDDLLRNGVGIYAQGTACSEHSKRQKSSSKNVTPVRNLTSELQDLKLVSSKGGEINNTTTVEATIEPLSTWDAESQTSRTKIIRQTTWNVNSELRSNEQV